MGPGLESLRAHAGKGLQTHSSLHPSLCLGPGKVELPERRESPPGGRLAVRAADTPEGSLRRALSVQLTCGHRTPSPPCGGPFYFVWEKVCSFPTIGCDVQRGKPDAAVTA